MKKGEQKRQKKALKKRTEKKVEQKLSQLRTAGLAQLILRQARTYPFEGCWVQETWKDGGLAVVVVARRQPNGNLAFGNYLVDYYCLGLKDTYWNVDIPAGIFRNDAMPKMYQASGRPISISPDLAHEIIYGAIDYAAQYGFHPPRDFRDSQLLLAPPEMHPRSGAVEFGKDGQPFYIAGPHDNPDAIMRQLLRTAGEGHFHYFMPLGDPLGDFDDLEIAEDDGEGSP
jgi:hypothetical protein